jgi:hypothetical protein
MFWIGVIIGLFAGTFLGLCFGGLLAASSQADDHLALSMLQQGKRHAITPTDEIRQE